MKKKASLLISGITTVAMLAVAVGSFAAWDQLKASNEPAFTANTGDPVVLTVENGTNETFSGKTLIPTGALKDTTTDVEEMTGRFKPSYTGDVSKDATGVYATIAYEGTDKDLLKDIVVFKVYAVEGELDTGTRGTEVTAKAVNGVDGAYELTAGTAYEVVATLDEAKISGNNGSSLAKKQIGAKVTCQAYK